MPESTTAIVGAFELAEEPQSDWKPVTNGQRCLFEYPPAGTSGASVVIDAMWGVRASAAICRLVSCAATPFSDRNCFLRPCPSPGCTRRVLATSPETSALDSPRAPWTMTSNEALGLSRAACKSPGETYALKLESGSFPESGPAAADPGARSTTATSTRRPRAPLPHRALERVSRLAGVS
jgi:hypothetical protein